MKNKLNIYITRHGETDWNVQLKLQGRSDIPLNAHGAEQAEKTGLALKQQGIVFDRVYSSPLQRAVKTAELMSGFTSEKIIKDRRIIEFAFGRAEGATREERRTIPELNYILNFFENPPEYAPPEDAETFRSVFARTKDFWQNELLPLEATDTKNVLVVTHGGTLQSLLMHADGRELKDYWAVKFPNCSLNLITVKDSTLNVEWTGRVLY